MDASPAGMAEPAHLIILGAVLNGLSGVLGLAMKRAAQTGQKAATAIAATGSLIGLAGAISAILSNRFTAFTILAALPFGPCEIGVDPLSALFLVPVFIISACCGVYGLGYWSAAKHPRTARKLSFFLGLLTASLALLLTARDGVSFLVFWEIMALAAFFALATDDREKGVREAAYIYLVATHAGTLALFATFSLLRAGGTSFVFPFPGTLDGGTPMAAAVFCTALFGFGLKAGIMPLHVWLPGAHASAPSHVSALMSGVIIKMGIYGLVRVLSFFTHVPLWWGIAVLVAGGISGVLGVAFAIGQHDLKRLLAYHSIENIGIIAMGLGVALVGTSIESPPLVLLGMGGALLHVVNHALFKSLLFLGGGSVIHATGTREIDLMGGVARRMPWSAALFLVGAVAICGLPPLNGFVSEYLVYLGFFTGVSNGSGVAVPFLALSAPALALIGGLAVLCFVKVFGAVFLGVPRSGHEEAHGEAGAAMRLPMLTLGLLCTFIGLFPPVALRIIQPALDAWHPGLALSGRRLADVAPVGWITVLGLALLLGVAIFGAIFRWKVKASPHGSSVTWDCGYARPTPRMQYTSSSFAEMLVKLFAAVLRPRTHMPAVKGPFPARADFSSHVPEAVLELAIEPALASADRRLSAVRRLQSGQLHFYILYIFLTLAALLVWGY